jgi:hypothetical protein
MANTKTRIVRKFYVGPNGVVSRKPIADWTAVRFEYLAPTKDADGNAIVVTSTDFPRADLSEDMVSMLAAFGIFHKVGDDLAGIAEKAKAAGVAEHKKHGFALYAQERGQDLWAQLRDGVWLESSTDAVGGNLLFLAIARAKEEAKGAELTMEDRQKIANMLSDEATAKALAADLDVKIYMETIKQEKAEARRRKLMEEAAAEGRPAGESALSKLLAE